MHRIPSIHTDPKMRRAYRAASRAAPLAAEAAARTCALNCICAVDESTYRVFRPTAALKLMKKRLSACSDSSRVGFCAPRWGEEGPIWLEFNQTTRGLRRNAQDWPRVVASDARHGRYRNTVLHETQNSSVWPSWLSQNDNGRTGHIGSGSVCAEASRRVSVHSSAS